MSRQLANDTFEGWPPPEGVHVFSMPHIPDEVLRTLDQQESPFVAAGRVWPQALAKQRPGEGLNWDTPGFELPR